ncbi:hypothetical protein ACFL2V_02280 [Pseudomonadota bacterium]
MLKFSRKESWIGGLEIAGMLFILISFYYQTFYEGNNLTQRYDSIRFKLELIQNEVINNSHLIGNQSDYSLGDYWKGFNENRADLNELSEEHISTIDEINQKVSEIRAWIFIAGSIFLIVAKYLQYYWKEPEETTRE